MPPRVSIIVPSYNEEATIRQLLEAISGQSYPLGQMEVIIADGLSQDGTLGQIESFRQDTPGLVLRVVENPKRTIPSGLNCAIRVAKGDILIRMDAHSQPYQDYVSRCVAALDAGAGDNVGGIWEIKPGKQTWVSESIALAAGHPLGVGDARYRIGSQASEVDTVPFGAFHKALVKRIGFFDETLLTNEDYEFNSRIRKSGGRIWLDPAIISVYFARATLPELAKQYWRYGFWKFRMLLRYPETIRWRQALPPLFVSSVLGLFLLSWWPLAKWLLALELAVYTLMLLLVGVQTAFRQRKVAFLIGIPLAIATMHFAWGLGFMASLIARGFGVKTNG